MTEPTNLEQRKSRLSVSDGRGYIPPQALDLEEKVLATILYDGEFFIDVADIIRPEHFYRMEHQKIMEAIVALSVNNHPIDIATVCMQLKSMGMLEMVGGQYFITELSSKAKSAKNIEYHCRLIIQKFMQRDAIRISNETIQEAYLDTTDIFNILEKNQTEMFNILADTQKKQAKPIREYTQKAVDNMHVEVVDGITGVPSGFRDLDNITGGWQKQDLVIIAARPAMGKTAFVLRLARNASVDYDKPVVVFSLEMSGISLTNRILSGDSEVKLERMIKNKCTDEDYEKIDAARIELDAATLLIDDTANLNIFEFRAKCRRLKAQYDIQMVIVDYLQLMSGGDKMFNREQEIGKISRACKSVAKELDIPVLALSQLSRAVESRAGNNKRPMLSDLRESGNIEQDADMVIFLHRPEYYGIIEDAQGKSTIGLSEVIIAKHRNGVTDTIKLDFNGSIQKFSDYDVPEEVKPAQAEMEFGSTNNAYTQPTNVDYNSYVEDENDDPPF